MWHTTKLEQRDLKNDWVWQTQNSLVHLRQLICPKIYLRIDRY
jgi:hypothetical protein